MVLPHNSTFNDAAYHELQVISLLSMAIEMCDLVTIRLLLEKLTVRSVLGNCKDEDFQPKYVSETDPHRVWKEKLVEDDTGISVESIVLMIPDAREPDGSSFLSNIMKIPDNDDIFQ